MADKQIGLIIQAWSFLQSFSIHLLQVRRQPLHIGFSGLSTSIHQAAGMIISLRQHVVADKQICFELPPAEYMVTFTAAIHYKPSNCFGKYGTLFDTINNLLLLVIVPLNN